MTYPWHLYLMGAIYIFAGIMHFIRPKVYLRIMPRYLPAHKTLVLLSGVAEVLLGMGLFFKETKDLSIYGIIAMLAVFLLVHFYMLSSKKASAGVPKWLLFLRLPIQFILMYWAFIYLKV
ncbi:MauE/DoxX family redox-associated membrane protein [Maribacter sp.]|uniref:DoxX family protein n=1 Tax=Maribacter sp. TaxID=1897614 RepID=UPI00329A362B